MNRDHELEDKMDNVVSFPFGGSDRVSPSSQPTPEINDPIEELLNEFADWEMDEEEWEPHVTISPQDLASMFPMTLNESDDEIELLGQQIELLEDVTKRMKFYLDEVELFTPHLKR